MATYVAGRIECTFCAKEKLLNNILVGTKLLQDQRILGSGHLFESREYSFAIHREIRIFWVCDADYKLKECRREVAEGYLQGFHIDVVD